MASVGQNTGISLDVKSPMEVILWEVSHHPLGECPRRASHRRVSSRRLEALTYDVLPQDVLALDVSYSECEFFHRRLCPTEVIVACLAMISAAFVITCATKHAVRPWKLESARPVRSVIAVVSRCGRKHAGVISLVMPGRASPRLDRRRFVTLPAANGRDQSTGYGGACDAT